MTANNFVTARTRRRRIIKLLGDQQELDSTCSEKLRNTISSHTRKILKIVSDLLMGLSAENTSPEDRAAFGRIAHSSTAIERWFELRMEEESSAIEIVRLTNILKAAEKEYDQLAPFGYLSDVFADKEAERKIEAARARRNSLAIQRELEEKVHNRKVQAIQTSAAVFLCNAMTPQGLADLQAVSSVSKDLQEALSRMNTEVKAIWTFHTRSQSGSLEKVRAAIADLFAVYETEDVSTILVRGSHARSGD